MKNLIGILLLAATATAAFAAPEPEKKLPAAGVPPGKEKSKEAEAPPALAFTFEKPAVKSFADFPKVALRTATQTSYVGLQYGTGKTDVAYLCFDPATAQDTPDRGYLHFAGSTNAPIPLRGHTEQAKPQKNVKIAKVKAERFEVPPLHARMGSSDFTYKVMVTCGHDSRANVHLSAEVLMKAEKPVLFALHANLSNIAVPSPNEIKVLPLLGAVELRIYQQEKVSPPWVRPYLQVGENFIFEPMRGMEDTFILELKNKETGKITDKGKLPVKIPEYSGVGESGAGSNFELKGAKAGNYEAAASIDLGVFGHPSVFVPVHVSTPEKKKTTK